MKPVRWPNHVAFSVKLIRFFAKQPDFLCIFSDIAEFIEPAHP